jgi:hypothetical protein
MAASGFWDNQERAQGLVAELRRITAALKPIKELTAGADDLRVLLEFLPEDDTSATRDELAALKSTLEKQVAAVELCSRSPRTRSTRTSASRRAKGGPTPATGPPCSSACISGGPRTTVTRPS